MTEPRRATIDDAPTIAEVYLRSRRASIPAIPPPAHSDDDVRAWFVTRVLPEMETWVLDDDDGGDDLGAPVAVVAMLVIDDGWVEQLYVDPAHTGRGLGSSLIDVAKGRSPGGLDLWTFQANTRARRFYERHGFTAIEETAGDNEEGAPDVRYRWSPTGIANFGRPARGPRVRSGDASDTCG